MMYFKRIQLTTLYVYVCVFFLKSHDGCFIHELDR